MSVINRRNVIVYVSSNHMLQGNVDEYKAYQDSLSNISYDFTLVSNPNDDHHFHVLWVKPEEVDKELKSETKHSVKLVGCYVGIVARLLPGRPSNNIRYFENDPVPCILNYIKHSKAYASMAESSIRLKQYNYANQVYSGFDMYKHLKYGKKKLIRNVSVSVEMLLNQEQSVELKKLLGGAEIKAEKATIHVSFTDTKPDEPGSYHIHIKDLYSPKMEETKYHTYVYTDPELVKSSLKNLASVIRLGVDGLNANIVLTRPSGRFTQVELEASLNLLNDPFK